GQGDRAEGKTILASLPQMQRGEGVVWVPGRGVLETAAFPLKATFDSSKTPERGEAAKARTLKPLDLGALKERLASVEAETKANDPRALKAEIARLKAELVKRPTVAAEADPKVYADARNEGYAEGELAGRAAGQVAGQAVMLARCQTALNGFRVDDAAPAQ